MKRAGYLLRIDKLGRVVIPKPLRDSFDVHTDDVLEVFTEGGSIVMKKYAPCCVFCGSEDHIVEYKSKAICKKCLDDLSSKH